MILRYLDNGVRLFEGFKSFPVISGSILPLIFSPSRVTVSTMAQPWPNACNDVVRPRPDTESKRVTALYPPHPSRHGSLTLPPFVFCNAGISAVSARTNSWNFPVLAFISIKRSIDHYYRRRFQYKSVRWCLTSVSSFHRDSLSPRCPLWIRCQWGTCALYVFQARDRNPIGVGLKIPCCHWRA